MLEILITLLLMAAPEYYDPQAESENFPHGFILAPEIGQYVKPGDCPTATWGAICSCVQRDRVDGGTGKCIKKKIIDFDWLKDKNKEEKKR